MWLWYNWRSAIVLSAELIVLDEEHWDGWKDIDAIAKRIKILQQGMLTPEANHLAGRFDDATIVQDGDEDLPSFDWPRPSKEALSCLDQGMMRLGQQQLMETATNPDYRLEHLVNSCDELRETTLIHEARIIEWLSMMYPQAILGRDRVGLIRSLAKSEQVADLAKKWSVDAPDYEEVYKEWKVMKKLAEITNMSYKQLDATEHQIRLVSESYMPSLSQLLGPMLAARMCVTAHSALDWRDYLQAPSKYWALSRLFSNTSNMDLRRLNTVIYSCTHGLANLRDGSGVKSLECWQERYA